MSYSLGQQTQTRSIMSLYRPLTASLRGTHSRLLDCLFSVFMLDSLLFKQTWQLIMTRRWIFHLLSIELHKNIFKSSCPTEFSTLFRERGSLLQPVTVEVVHVSVWTGSILPVSGFKSGFFIKTKLSFGWWVVVWICENVPMRSC